MKHSHFIINILCLLVLVPLSLSAEDNGTDEGKRIDEIIKGERTNCSSVEEEGMTPTLSFETIGPRVSIDDYSTNLNLQMKIIYFRCIKNASGETPKFTVTDPSTSYQYTVEQLDGTPSTIKVKKQSHRFSVSIKNAKFDPVTPKKMGDNGNVSLVQVSLPIKKLLTAAQEIKLRHGNPIDITIPMVSELSTDYVVDSQTQNNTDFEPGTTIQWEIKLSLKGKKSIKAVLTKIR